MPPNHLILCHPLLLLPSIFPSIRVFLQWVIFLHQVAKVFEFQLQNQSLSFRMDWLDLLAVQGTLKNSPTPQFKSIQLTPKKHWFSLVSQEASPLHSRCPHDLCSLFSINSLPSEIFCVWKFSSNPVHGPRHFGWQLFPPKFCTANPEQSNYGYFPKMQGRGRDSGESRLFWWPEFEGMSLLEVGMVLEKEACD